ncbi:hypothetical protein C8R43DRAFT_1004405 [Mycena crocata]|nr:hypothetical protein C8R43DRAFT_1004405 [Mycena crocata]
MFSLANLAIRLRREQIQLRLPEDILPLEMWTCILDILSDDDLRVAATACHTFNQLCFDIFLAHGNSISTDSIPSGTLSLKSPLTRPGGLQRAVFFHTIRRLSCTFTGDTIVGDLQVLSRVLPYATGISHLKISFLHPILNRDVDDCSDDTLRAAIHSVLYCSALPVDGPLGPVAFVGSVGETVRLFPALRKPFERESGIRRRLQNWIAGLELISVLSIKVVPLPSSCGHGPGRMIVLNNDTAGVLVFPNDAEVPHGSARPTALALNAILPHITLPCLKELRIRTSGIDPTILSAFLGRHKALVELYYELEEHLPVPPVLITPAVALPHLRLLSSPHRNNAAIPLINGVRFSFPCTVGIGYEGESAAVARGVEWKPILHRIAELQVETGLIIEFNHSRRDLDPVLVDEEEQEMMKSLRNVTYVELETWYNKDLDRILPWLTMLPALTRVAFRSTLDYHHAVEDTFRRELAAQTSRDVEVEVMQWMRSKRYYPELIGFDSSS